MLLFLANNDSKYNKKNLVDVGFDVNMSRSFYIDFL